MARTNLGNTTGKIDLLYNRHQQAFLTALRAKTPSGRNAFHRLALFAGRRGGKTKVGALAVSEKVQQPRSLGWVCAPSYDDLYTFVIPEVLNMIPAAWIGNWSEQHFELELKNYAKVQFRSLDDPDKARGPGLDWAWIDETRKVQELAWNTMLPALTDKGGQAWFTTSPNGFDWSIAEGSRILTISGEVPIERLMVGDVVWTRKGWRRLAHVTRMGLKRTIAITVGSRTLRLTPEHRVATPTGWQFAGLLSVGDRVCCALADSTPALSSGHEQVLAGVGVSLRTVGAGELVDHPRRAMDVDAMRHGFEMVGSNAGSVPAHMVDLGTDRYLRVNDPVGHSSGALLTGSVDDVLLGTERVASGAASLRDRSVPDPALSDDRYLTLQPLDCQSGTIPISRVSHGVILPVWDIGVEGEHEFIAEGICVHNCYETFWLPAVQKVPGYWAVKYRTADNPVFQTQDGIAELADAKRAMDPLFYQQEFEADFVTFTGAIYGALLDSQICRTDEQIRAVLPDWPLIDPAYAAYVGIDPGSDHPFAACLAVMGPKGLVFIGEVLERGKPIGEYVNLMHRMLGKFSPHRPFEPAVWAVDKSQKQFRIELAQAPHHIFTTPAPNDVENGVRRVQSWLAQKQMWFLLPEAQPERGVPILVEQMRGHRWAENTTPDGQARKERVIKRKDDLPDALRYLTMSGPTLIEIDQSPSKGLRDLSGFDPQTRYEMELMRDMRKRREGGEVPFFASDSDLPGLLQSSDEDLTAMGDFYR